jgi:hypothetical protein
MDNLEKFIHENREQFDNREPGDELWNNISNKLDHSHRPERFINHWIWKAASIVLFVAVLGLLIERQFRQAKEVTINRPQKQTIEFKQVEEYYTSLIVSKRAEIQDYLQANPSFRNEFTGDILQLDSMYVSLKMELSNNYSEKIVDAMIVNLQMRIRILNQQLNILQKIKNAKENEKPSI